MNAAELRNTMNKIRETKEKKIMSKIENEVVTVNKAEAQEAKKQKKSEKLVMAPASKHMERMGLMESNSTSAVEESGVEVDAGLSDLGISVDYDILLNSEGEAEAMEQQNEIELLLREMEYKDGVIAKKRAWLMYCEKNKIDPCEVVVGTDVVSEYEIVMRAVGNGKQRKYNIYERKTATGKKQQSFLNENFIFDVNKIKKDKSLLGDVISSFYGDYEITQNEIIANILRVERERLLTIFEMEDDSTIEERVEELKFHLISNPLQEEVVHLEIKGKTEIGIIGDEASYQRILDKWFPGYCVRNFNAELKASGFLKVTGNEGTRCTRNIEMSKAKALGLSRCKFYNFNFGDKFAKEFMDAYEEAKRTQEEKNNDK